MARVESPSHKGIPYIYTPLPPVDITTTSTSRAKQLLTRLLTIHKGEYEDDIEVDVEVVDLVEESSRPEYEALSYVWGSGAKPSSVFVGEDKHTIPITTNLDEALRHLRYRDRPRYMWIDALCIDQGNKEERSRQVSNMSHIYWTAPRVVVWLGPSADDSDHALETLEYIGSRVQVDWRTGVITGVTELDDEQWGFNSRDLPLTGRQCTAILALMQRPWFERIWIRQEVFKADDKSRVICGRKALAWPRFQQGLWCCTCHLTPRALNREQRSQWNARRDVVVDALRRNPYSVFRLRESTVGALCSDPRDRIYALLGLLYEDEKQLGIVPDYSKTTSELYQDVALRHITFFRSLELLHSCGRDDPEASPSNTTCSTSIPTWVPNWSVPANLPRPLSLVRVFCPFAAYTKYIGGGILRAAGVSIGTIQDFIELDVSTTFGALAASIRALVPSDATYRTYPGGGNLWDAYRITLCLEYFCDRTEPPNFETSRTSDLSLSIQGSKEAMRSIMAAEDLPDNNFLNLVILWNDIGRFFITREGYLGWGPKTINIGDQIVTFLGCRKPIMIRHSPDLDSEHFEIIGPCYLHGFMFGEAFLGPLPDSIRPVLHIGKEHFPRFHDSRTGDLIAVEDPRLSTLPADLDHFRKGREEGLIYKPYIEPETWRSRGVEVVDFDLV